MKIACTVLHLLSIYIIIETLYQAREGEPNYEEWTNHIKNTVDTIAKNNTKSQDENPFSTQELNKCIKTLKRRKSTGPDNIPNEALIEADPITRAIYLETLNKVYTEEIIPQEWQHGEIKRIYKGKGTKGKCSNERGITLASNMGKLFERLMNNKIKKETLITPAQAGGQEGMATVDHLMILNSLINQSKKTKKKELYIAFLDVTKAYDKAWLDAIMYSMHKSGLKGKNWRIAREINSNLTATIKTKFGPTRMIKIKDSIRQGGVLSVIEYANLIDEIAKELQEMEVGNQNLWNTPTPGCLLWMDDVALIHNDKEELNKMLSITNDIANRYHIKFGKDKSQILTINNKNPTSDTLIGNQILDPTETYKYLGMTMNSKGNLEDHIKKTKGKTEAALQTILSLAGNDEFHNIEMDIIWKLVHSCIIPIITYGAEIWTPTKNEEETLQRILNNVLKRILRTPITTPAEIVIAETGIWDIETQIMKKQLIYYHKIKTKRQEENLTNKIALDPKNPWKKRIENTLLKINVNNTDLLEKTHKNAKILVNQKLKEYQINKIYNAAGKKSKVEDYVWNKTHETIIQKPTYMNNLTRKECTSIFAVRSRMLKVKGNYKNKYPNLTCRWCTLTNETQEHILKECREFKPITGTNTYETYYEDTLTAHKTTANIIQKVTEKLKEQE